jgi:hypothetical protein
MAEMDLETIQLLEAARRASQPNLTERQALDALTEVMARFLHYQDSGEPSLMETPAKVLVKEYSEIPKPIRDRYLNDPKFHAQVDRAVATVLDIWDRCSERR